MHYLDFPAQMLPYGRRHFWLVLLLLSLVPVSFAPLALLVYPPSNFNFSHLMNQIFAHRAPEPITLLHDPLPPGWINLRYRKHGLKPHRRIPVGQPARPK